MLLVGSSLGHIPWCRGLQGVVWYVVCLLVLRRSLDEKTVAVWTRQINTVTFCYVVSHVPCRETASWSQRLLVHAGLGIILLSGELFGCRSPLTASRAQSVRGHRENWCSVRAVCICSQRESDLHMLWQQAPSLKDTMSCKKEQNKDL